MFRKLRNRLILINLGITTFVIVTVFTTIYLISTKTAENRPLNIQEYSTEYNQRPENANNSAESGNEQNLDEVREMVLFSVREEKKNAANNLLITLICCGVAIEIAVALVSCLLAEEAIKPVKEAYESQKVFIANASHEIKTPLAAISANLEAADIHGNKWISNVELETAKLTKLNNELLNLARTDLVTNTKSEEVDLKELTLKILDSFEPRLNGKTLNKQISLDKKVKINREDFEQILTILMDNAIKYSEKNISVELHDHTLVVSNDGKTIGAEKLPHIFDRFYQADKTREGVGLGLAIAKAVAERNHWKLGAKSNRKTTFTLNF